MEGGRGQQAGAGAGAGVWAGTLGGHQTLQGAPVQLETLRGRAGRNSATRCCILSAVCCAEWGGIVALQHSLTLLGVGQSGSAVLSNPLPSLPCKSPPRPGGRPPCSAPALPEGPPVGRWGRGTQQWPWTGQPPQAAPPPLQDQRGKQRLHGQSNAGQSFRTRAVRVDAGVGGHEGSKHHPSQVWAAAHPPSVRPAERISACMVSEGPAGWPATAPRSHAVEVRAAGVGEG